MAWRKYASASSKRRLTTAHAPSAPSVDATDGCAGPIARSAAANARRRNVSAARASPASVRARATALAARAVDASARRDRRSAAAVADVAAATMAGWGSIVEW